jgi:hypothetical protein
MKKIIIIAVVILAAIFIVAFVVVDERITIVLPEYSQAQDVSWIPQNWTPAQREWFYRADQGTQTFSVPYEWFIALEQPSLSLGSSGLLSDSTYLDRFGFIVLPGTHGNSELPIGFAHAGRALHSDGSIWLNPQTNAQMTSLGFTCAACHTGRFTYKNKAVIVDGGPALTNVQRFQEAVEYSIFCTRYVPFRFDRFADRVLGAGADQAKKQLRAQFDTVYSEGNAFIKLENSVKARSIEEGFARLDALTRIGNTVFAIDLSHTDSHAPTSENFAAYTAPVHYPRIWDAPWFAWVQYNGSIHQPMMRNAGEALGVGAKVNLAGPKDQLFSTSIDVKTVYELEAQLAGTSPDAASGFHGLTSPKWPAQILPAVNAELAATGEALYKGKARCQECHLPPVSDPAFWTVPQWQPANADGQRYLNVNMIDISHVGTDPAQAEDMKNRNVVIPDGLGIPSGAFGVALAQLIELTVNHWYDTQQPPTPGPVRNQMNGFRDGSVRAPLQYKARPLDGVWATPPYLHNGSVPNLYALLSPVSERPKTFYLGNREFDPVDVGYRTEEFPGGFKFDVSIRGNLNSGHEFNNGSGPGIIGPFLTPDERRALVEYLKTL